MEPKDKFTLGLELATDPRWVNIAEQNIEEILVDHAYCEQKAASTGISLILQFSELEKLVDELTAIVDEEWDHFRRVLQELKKRGYKLGQKRKDIYIEQLDKVIKKGGSRDQMLLEKLLFSAMIEARSCERFKILWKNIPDEGLSDFYYELMVSEAGHYKTFLQLAKEYIPEDQVNTRWRELLEQEANIVRNLEVRGDRMH